MRTTSDGGLTRKGIQFHFTLPGSGDSAAANFVRSLGDQAGPFAVSLAGPEKYSKERVAAADREIAFVSPLLANGEGGILTQSGYWPSHTQLFSQCCSTFLTAAAMSSMS